MTHLFPSHQKKENLISYYTYRENIIIFSFFFTAEINLQERKRRKEKEILKKKKRIMTHILFGGFGEDESEGESCLTDICVSHISVDSKRCRESVSRR